MRPPVMVSSPVSTMVTRHGSAVRRWISTVSFPRSNVTSAPAARTSGRTRRSRGPCTRRRHEVVDPVRAVDLHDVPEDRTPADLDHRLGTDGRLLGQARAQTTRQNDCSHRLSPSSVPKGPPRISTPLSPIELTCSPSFRDTAVRSSPSSTPALLMNAPARTRADPVRSGRGRGGVGPPRGTSGPVPAAGQGRPRPAGGGDGVSRAAIRRAPRHAARPHGSGRRRP